MEKELILKWLSGYGYGDGSGDGSGYGSGCGYGDGSGYGSGCGYGDGSGDGSGCGYGYGSGCGYGDGSGDGSGYGSGCGYGDGSGNGDGYGSGCGYGDGSGCGYGDGSGDGSGYGSGCGSKLIKVNGEDIYYIDNVPTIITAILGNYAKGYTVGEDYQLTPCYVAKSSNGLFSHGKNLHDAEQSLIEKINESMTIEERIDLFCQNFKKGEKYKGKEFFDWHNRLTGSCLYGRNQFVKNHNLSIEEDYSVEDFIKLTENQYGSNIIKQLKEKWRNMYG